VPVPLAELLVPPCANEMVGSAIIPIARNGAIIRIEASSS
jgi:hypothetical protein